MKKRLILSVVIIGLLLQSQLAYCSENKQTWMQRLASYFGLSDRNKVVALNSAADAIRVSSLSLGTYIAGEHYAGLVSADFLQSVMSGYAILNMGGILLKVIADNIDKANKKTEDRLVAIQTIKNYLRIAVLYNDAMYPTRSSKIHALLKKEDFLSYVEDKGDILDIACRELIQEMEEGRYSKEKYIQELQDEDDKIDAYMADLRINQHMDEAFYTEDKLDHLKGGLQVPVEKMQAYLSLYYRLKAQLAVENNLPYDVREAKTKKLRKLYKGLSAAKENKLFEQKNEEKRIRDESKQIHPILEGISEFAKQEQ